MISKMSVFRYIVTVCFIIALQRQCHYWFYVVEYSLSIPVLVFVKEILVILFICLCIRFGAVTPHS